MKDSARYAKIVEWSEEDNCYVGSAPGLLYGGTHGDGEKAVGSLPTNEFCGLRRHTRSRTCRFFLLRTAKPSTVSFRQMCMKGHHGRLSDREDFGICLHWSRPGTESEEFRVPDGMQNLPV